MKVEEGDDCFFMEDASIVGVIFLRIHRHKKNDGQTSGEDQKRKDENSGGIHTNSSQDMPRCGDRGGLAHIPTLQLNIYVEGSHR